MDKDNEKRLDLALKLVSNDREKAKKLISGELKDVRVVNGKFAIETADIYGLFQLYFHLENETLLNISVVTFSDISVYDKNNIGDAWKLLYTVITQEQSSKSVLDATDFIEHFENSIEGYQLFYDVEDQIEESLVDTFCEIIAKSYGLEDATCMITMTDLNSLEMADAGISISFPKPQATEESVTESSDSRPEIERQIAHTVEGSLSISPVKGKFIHDIVVDDLIKVMLVNKDVISKKVATSLGALDNKGNYTAIRGRVKEIISLPDGGYRIYALVAKNVLVRIIEEEDIKADMWDYNSKGIDSTTKNQPHLVTMILALVVVIALAVGIVGVLL